MEVQPIFVPYLLTFSGNTRDDVIPSIHTVFLPLTADRRVIYSIGHLYFGSPSVCLCFPMDKNNFDNATKIRQHHPSFDELDECGCLQKYYVPEQLTGIPCAPFPMKKICQCVNKSVACTWWMRQVGKNWTWTGRTKIMFFKMHTWCNEDSRLHNIFFQYVAPTFPLTENESWNASSSLIKQILPNQSSLWEGQGCADKSQSNQEGPPYNSLEK